MGHYPQFSNQWSGGMYDILPAVPGQPKTNRVSPVFLLTMVRNYCNSPLRFLTTSQVTILTHLTQLNKQTPSLFYFILFLHFLHFSIFSLLFSPLGDTLFVHPLFLHLFPLSFCSQERESCFSCRWFRFVFVAERKLGERKNDLLHQPCSSQKSSKKVEIIRCFRVYEFIRK